MSLIVNKYQKINLAQKKKLICINELSCKALQRLDDWVNIYCGWFEQHDWFIRINKSNDTVELQKYDWFMNYRLTYEHKQALSDGWFT